MLDLNNIRMRAEEFLREAERGYAMTPMRAVLAHLVTPLLQLIEAMESRKADRWLTLEEVIIRTGWSRRYFDKRLAGLGGRSRLRCGRQTGKPRKRSPGSG